MFEESGKGTSTLNFGGALGDAVFMTGPERNSDNKLCVTLANASSAAIQGERLQDGMPGYPIQVVEVALT